MISGREEIRKWEKKCNACKIRNAKAAVQIMSPLPESRMKASIKPFTRCGLDFGGPFLTKVGRGKVRNKRYLCLFTCLSTRAVHLEMAYSLDTNAFINAFWRFTHRRGFPEEVTSDNGKNFVAGEKEIKHLVESLRKDEIINRTSTRKIKWNFNPPYAPHHGGVFESMIKASKKAMNIQFNNADITAEELLTLITGAESMVNARPITYQSANPKDLTPITPNHFLHGQIGGEYAPELEENSSLKTRWKRVQQILDHYWKRWIREWLPSIGKRSKWTSQQENCQVGDIVLVIWPDVQRGKWPLGKIVETFPGIDGNIRTVKVLVNGKIYNRAINTLYPLKLNEL